MTAHNTASDETVARSSLWSPEFLAVAAMEFWERFAMYGVKSLLVVILLDRILVGDLSHVAGAAAMRDASAALFGPVSMTGLASQLYGYVNALLYLSIPAGGLIGDLLGNRRIAVACGGAAMLAGLVLMLRDHSFLIGLPVFAIGTGLLKGNLSVQIGLLFRDKAQRRRGYTIYLGFLNAGVICGPLICGAVAAYAGPVCAIAVAAAAVAIGLFFYARRATPTEAADPVATRGTADADSAPAVAMLVVAMAAVYLCFAAYEQVGNIFLVWARTRIDLDFSGWTMPVAWFLSLDGLLTLMLIAAWQMMLRLLHRRGIVAGAITQIFLGALLCAAGYIVLAIASARGGTLALPWALSYLVLVDAAIVLIWPSGLSVVAEIAPRRLVGSWTGLFYLHGFFAHLWVGMMGVYYDRMTTPLFWLLHAAMAGSAALLILVAGIPILHRLRAPQAITTSAPANASA